MVKTDYIAMWRDRYNRDKMKAQRAGTWADLSSFRAEDFFEWTACNAQVLRVGQVDQADMVRQLDLRKISRLWNRTIVSQGIEIEAALKQSPSLRGKLQTEGGSRPGGAARRAIAEVGAQILDLESLS